MNEETVLFKKRLMMFNEGVQYILEEGKTKITNKLIDRYLEDYNYRKPTKIDGKDGLFYKMIEHVRNKQRMSNTVDYKPRTKYVIKNDPNLDYEFCYLKETLFDFDPRKVLNEYRYYQSELRLFNNIKIGISELLKVNPNDGGLKALQGRLPSKENPEYNNYWVSFSKSIISIAEFLSRFNNFDEFNKFVKNFDIDDEKRIYLALLLENEIFGYGFALACDFLKENCSQQYVKPDAHIINLFTNPKIIKVLDIKYSQEMLDKVNKKKNYNTKDQIEIFRAVKNYSKSIDKLPYEVDKLFWLVGSGYFYRLPDVPCTEFKIQEISIEKFIAYFEVKFTSKYGYSK